MVGTLFITYTKYRILRCKFICCCSLRWCINYICVSVRGKIHLLVSRGFQPKPGNNRELSIRWFHNLFLRSSLFSLSQNKTLIYVWSKSRSTPWGIPSAAGSVHVCCFSLAKGHKLFSQIWDCLHDWFLCHLVSQSWALLWQKKLAEMFQLTVLLIQLHQLVNSSWHGAGPWITRYSFGFNHKKKKTGKLFGSWAGWGGIKRLLRMI